MECHDPPLQPSDGVPWLATPGILSNEQSPDIAANVNTEDVDADYGDQESWSGTRVKRWEMPCLSHGGRQIAWLNAGSMC